MSTHVLTELALPDRYERLVNRLGAEVANLLTMPEDSNIDGLRALANEVLTRDEGVLVPLAGHTGIGKTTFVMNASQWLPSMYGPTCQYEGELSFDGLVSAVKEFSRTLPADNRRILPINIDHRENAPPSDAELSALKRFLRTNAAGVPSLIFWPETSEEIAASLSKRYV
jgi:energy-coupling factor transporter ATP-binding protein EcfA2